MKRNIKNHIIYQIFLRAFTSKGTLKAAEKMLPQIADLGADIVYLCPIVLADDDMNQEFWSPRQMKSGVGNPKNPYRIKDYYVIDPEYGTDADLKSFVDTAHKLGLIVMLDLVYYHCGPEAVFIEEHPDFVLRDENGSIKNMSWKFPGLNFKSAELRRYLINNMKYFVTEFNIDAYRADVGDGIPLDFWEQARAELDEIKPDLIMLNEGTNPDYVKSAFDMLYGFGIAGVLQKICKCEYNVSKIKEYLMERKSQLPDGAVELLMFDSHDYANESYDIRFDTQFGPGATEAVHTLLLTLYGVPFIYNGYEVCDTNRHSIFYNRDYKGNMIIEWDNIFTEKGGKRYNYLKEMIKLRRGNPALTDGEVVWIDNNTPDEVISFIRSVSDQKIAVIINLSGKTVHTTLDIKIEPGEILNARETYTNGDKIDILPYGWCIIELQGE